jgi:hypothetical protein
LEPIPVHSLEDGTVLARYVASVQASGEPVLCTDEVRPTDSVEPVVKTVGAPTPIVEANQAPEDIARDQTDTERETVPVSPPFSPVSTAATAVIARRTNCSFDTRGRERNHVDAGETMEKVC